jgi:hypothetical protein
MVCAGNVAVRHSGCMIRQKWEPVFPRDKRESVRTESCSNKGWDRDPIEPNRITIWIDGSIMRRVFAIAVAGLGLAGCSSFSTDYFKSTPPTMQIQLESTPPGADARTSLGPGCKTPCAVTVPAPESSFTVSYSLNRFQPVTVPVQVSGSPGNFLSPSTTKIDPNPVVAELQPAAPPKSDRKSMRPRKKPRDTAAGSALQDPAQDTALPPASSTR